MPEENLPEIYDVDRAASEFLIYQTENGESRVQVRLFQQSVWLTQKLIADLFEKSVTKINEHIRNIYEEKELDPEATIRKFRIVQREGGLMVRFVMERNPDCARIECKITEPAPEKRLYSGNCGFSVPTIFFYKRIRAIYAQYAQRSG